MQCALRLYLSVVGVDSYFIVNHQNYFNICKQYYCIVSLKRIRAVAREKRVFNFKWELDYFMIETEAHTMMHLICSQVVKTVKGNSAKQHFCHHMSHTYAKLEGESRKICVENLKSLRQKTSCISTFIKSTNNCCEASYRVAYHLGEVGKPSSNGDLVKQCLIDVVKCIHSDKKADYSSLALSCITIQRQQNDIAKQLSLSMQTKVNKETSLFSLAVDKSTDIKDSAQLLVFICSLTPTFELYEDLFSMEPLFSHTCGEDIFVAAKNACIRNELELKNLHGICMNGALAMMGNIIGFVARFSEYVSKECDNRQLTNLIALFTKKCCVSNLLL